MSLCDQVGVFVGVHRLHVSRAQPAKHGFQPANSQLVAFPGFKRLGWYNFQEIALHQITDGRYIRKLSQSVSPYPISLWEGFAKHEFLLTGPFTFHAGRYQVSVCPVLESPSLWKASVLFVARFWH